MPTSPLRYPGGKAKLYPYFAELLKTNKLTGCHYSEPYAGGAGLAIRLLTTGFVKTVSINDIDDAVFAFWVSVLFDTARFCRLIDRAPITIDEWYRQKEIWDEGDLENPLALGFSTFFLNRTNRSGIIEGAGPIGGYEQNGSWKLGVRLVKEKQIENIQELSRFAPQITVTNKDALDFFHASSKKADTFIYLDPPYFVKGRKLYKNSYTPTDHEEIAKLLTRKRKVKWIVSYDDVPEIRRAYKAFSPITYNLNYSVGDKSIGTEVIFLSDPIVSPKLPGFKFAA